MRHNLSTGAQRFICRMSVSGLALAVLVLGAGWLGAAEQPPDNLQLVGDHWTPWDPPTSFPEGSEVYIIVTLGVMPRE